jgi:hypothetical protein
MGITDANSGEWTTITWPWPRAFFLKHYTLGIATKASTAYLYELVYNSGSWTAYALLDLGSITVNHIDIADFGPSYIISIGGTLSGNYGANNYIRDPQESPGLTALSEINDVNIPQFVACCNFRSQLIVGGITASIDYAEYADWEALGNSHVAWSGIGKITFRPDEDRTAGFMRIPWAKGDTGKIFAIREIADRVMVFGDYGFMGLVPYTSKVSTGFGRKYIPGPGIKHNSHVAGDESILCFIDNNEDLCITTDGQKIEVLGYREYIADMDSDDILVSYVPQKKRFFISDGSKGYCLTEYGLYKTNQLVTSAGMGGAGEFIGFFGDNEDYELRLETNTFDMKQRGKKTLETVELGVEYTKSSNYLEACVKYKNNYASSTFTQTSWKRLNPNGIVYPVVTSDEFRLKVRGGDYRGSTANISYIKGIAKMVDKRSVRGLYNVG